MQKKKYKYFEGTNYYYWCTKSATDIKGAWAKTFEKWEILRQGAVIGDPDYLSCGFCDLYNRVGCDEICKGCPIYEDTGEKHCEGTLFLKWKLQKKQEDAEKMYKYLKNLYQQKHQTSQ